MGKGTGHIYNLKLRGVNRNLFRIRVRTVCAYKLCRMLCAPIPDGNLLITNTYIS